MSSFAYPNAGPFGICLNQQLQQTFNENVAFSESAWENAKQNCQYGCVLPPGIPQWPPGVTPLSAPPNMSLKTPIARTDAQVINTLQSKPFQFDSPFVETREYKRFVDNSSPAVVRSLENRCGAPAVSSAVASSASLSRRLIGYHTKPCHPTRDADAQSNGCVKKRKRCESVFPVARDGTKGYELRRQELCTVAGRNNRSKTQFHDDT